MGRYEGLLASWNVYTFNGSTWLTSCKLESARSLCHAAFVDRAVVLGHRGFRSRFAMQSEAGCNKEEMAKVNSPEKMQNIVNSIWDIVISTRKSLCRAPF